MSAIPRLPVAEREGISAADAEVPISAPFSAGDGQKFFVVKRQERIQTWEQTGRTSQLI
jgi:hypothetical protein